MAGHRYVNKGVEHEIMVENETIKVSCIEEDSGFHGATIYVGIVHQRLLD